MKISYRTHPVLDRIEKRKLGVLSVTNEEGEYFKVAAPVFKDFFLKITETPPAVYKLTKPFIEAYNCASKRLLESSLWIDIPNGNYCFLEQDGDGIIIKIQNDTQVGVLISESVGFINSGNPKEGPHLTHLGGASIFYDVDKNDDGCIRSQGFVGYESERSKSEYDKSILDRICTYGMLLLFIKYADIETKVLSAGQKVKDIACVYKNETNSNVIILDSKWFTTLVKSESFKVRGHFRLQPKKKDGEWTKELIWINDFMKEGYTAPARKLSLS